MLLRTAGLAAAACARAPASRVASTARRWLATSSGYDDFDVQPLPFKGGLIDLSLHPGEAERAAEDGGAAFTAKLGRAVERLRADGSNSLWLDVPAVDAALAGHAARALGFDFHHAEGSRCVLKKWVHPERDDTIPTPLATHQVGCAGLITNDRGELLVIKEVERHNGVRLQWKLPGGMLERGEAIEDAVTREVWEETGLRTNFESVLSFWNRHHLPPWGQSDMYIVAHLSPDDADAQIKIDPAEISACRWMCMREFVAAEDHPLILRLLDHYFGITKTAGGEVVVAAEAADAVATAAEVPSPGGRGVPMRQGLQRVDVQWPGKPVCPTYIAAPAQ